MPAQMGIQLFPQNISGFPLQPAPAQAGAGMTSLKFKKLPDRRIALSF